MSTLDWVAALAALFVAGAVVATLPLTWPRCPAVSTSGGRRRPGAPAGRPGGRVPRRGEASGDGGRATPAPPGNGGASIVRFRRHEFASDDRSDREISEPLIGGGGEDEDAPDGVEGRLDLGQAKDVADDAREAPARAWWQRSRAPVMW